MTDTAKADTVNAGGDDAETPLARLLEVLELERLDRDLFRAWNPATNRGPRAALFGGQVAAHALRAAMETVEADHRPHSLHGYFLRPGRDGAHTILRVDRIRDGRSFTTRTVVALQEGEAIFSLTASFHKEEPGGSFQVQPAADVPSAADLIAAGQEPQDMWGTISPFERVEVPEEVLGDAPRRVMWVRTRGPLPEDPTVHACVLTFISDMGPMGAIRKALGQLHRRGMGASLDHSLWLHRRPRLDDWMLYDVSSLSNFGARGLATGTMHTADGVHVASVAQEGLFRLAPEA